MSRYPLLQQQFLQDQSPRNFMNTKSIDDATPAEWDAASRAVWVAGKPASTASAVQVGGDHYKKLKIQPMEYSMANKLDACQHTVVKYVTRFRDKGGLQDLQKAIHAIQLLIEHEYGKSPKA